MPLPRKVPLPSTEIVLVSVLAGVHHRTVYSYLRGRSVQRASRQAIESALESYGRSDLIRADDDQEALPRPPSNPDRTRPLPVLPAPRCTVSRKRSKARRKAKPKSGERPNVTVERSGS